MSGTDKSIRTLGARPKLGEKVASQLRAIIQRGDIAPGEKLPTENEMVEQFGVSRTVIREAISALRVDGLVNAHQGRGVFVSNDLSQQPFRLGNKDLSERDHLLQIMELRLSMEVSSASLAAERREASDIIAIEKAISMQHSAHLAGTLGQKEDFAFHLAIAEATRNTYIADFLHYLGPFIIPANAMRQMADSEREGYHQSLRAEHSEIADAIKNQDAVAAGNAMRSHLTRGLTLNKNTFST